MQEKRGRVNVRQLGAEREALAAEYLQGRGYRILERNYRTRTGEIDLVAKDGAVLVFVEVKYRKDASCGSPLSAVDARKQQRIARTARCYLMERGYGTETDCRFDVVAITGSEIVLLQHAFFVS